MRCLCCDGRWEEANSLLAEMDGGDRAPSVVTYNILINSLAFQGRTEQAMEVLEEMNKAFQLLNEMTRCGFNPDSRTYSALIRGLCLEGMYTGAMEVLSIMEESEYYKPTVDNFNAMILGLCKTRRTDLALEVFEMMVEKKRLPNETTYAIIVEGIAHEDELELAKEVLEELRKHKVIGQNAVDRIVMQFNLDFD